MIRPRQTASRLPQIIVVVALLLLVWWLQGREAVSPDPASRLETTAVEAARPTRAAEGGRAYDLAADERRGGHTLARHVGRTDDELRQRLARERSISAASTYTDQATAERTVARALNEHADRVAAWLTRDGNRPNLALDYHGPAAEVIGRTLERGRSTATPSTDAVVVLRWDGDRRYFVLTSYPEARR